MKKKLKTILMGMLALAVAVPSLTYHNKTYEAETGAGFILEKPEYTYAYVLGSGYIDALLMVY